MNTLPNRPVRISAARIVALVFLIVGVGFLIPGGILLSAGWAELPLLFAPDRHQGGMPDALATPLLGLIFGGLAAAFLLTAAILLLCSRRARLRREELLRFGVRVRGTVTEVRIDRSVRIGRRSPLYLLVTAEDPSTRQAVTIRSPRLWETTLSPGDPVDVLFDPMDPRRRLVTVEQEA